MRVPRLLLSSGLGLAVLAASACGSTPAWRTWHSASCDATFDLVDLPASGRTVSPTPWGEVVLSTHAELRPDGTRMIYGCRDIPAGYFATRTEDAMAREVLDAELAGFDAEWARGAVVQTAPGAVMAPLTDKAGQRAAVRIAASGRESRAHGSVVVGLAQAIVDHFVASVHPDPAPARDVTVRSAECLSEVAMPGWPTGSFVPGVATHLYTDTTGQYQLRCVFMDEAQQRLTPAELFARAKADTETETGLHLATYADVEVAGRYGRDFAFAPLDDDDTVLSPRMWVRFLVDGDRVQIATFIGGGAVGDEARGRRFAASLRPLRSRP